MRKPWRYGPENYGEKLPEAVSPPKMPYELCLGEVATARTVDQRSNYEFYRLVRQVGDFIVERLLEVVVLDDDREGSYSSDGPRVSCNQSATDNGILLDFSSESPHRLWTPWGSYTLFHAVRDYDNKEGLDETIEQILTEMDAHLYLPMYHTPIGTFGPVYEILRLDDVGLPKPRLLSDSTFEENEESERLWDELTVRFLTEHGQPPREPTYVIACGPCHPHGR